MSKSQPSLKSIESYLANYILSDIYKKQQENLPEEHSGAGKLCNYIKYLNETKIDHWKDEDKKAAKDFEPLTNNFINTIIGFTAAILIISLIENFMFQYLTFVILFCVIMIVFIIVMIKKKKTLDTPKEIILFSGVNAVNIFLAFQMFKNLYYVSQQINLETSFIKLVMFFVMLVSIDRLIKYFQAKSTFCYNNELKKIYKIYKNNQNRVDKVLRKLEKREDQPVIES